MTKALHMMKLIPGVCHGCTLLCLLYGRGWGGKSDSLPLPFVIDLDSDVLHRNV